MKKDIDYWCRFLCVIDTLLSTSFSSPSDSPLPSLMEPPSASPLPRCSSTELVPDSSVQFLLDLETHARSIACGIDMALRDLRGSLRGMSDLTCESVNVFASVVSSTCDSVDASIRSLYTMLAKTEELNKSLQSIEKLIQQIKETKRLVDLFEEQFVVVGGNASIRPPVITD